jgi:hypothetical protein
MLALLGSPSVVIFGETGRSLPQGSYAVDGMAEQMGIDQLRQDGYQVETFEDVDQAGRARQAEVHELGGGPNT